LTTCSVKTNDSVGGSDQANRLRQTAAAVIGGSGSKQEQLQSQRNR
jgi:hypothetical protein